MDVPVFGGQDEATLTPASLEAKIYPNVEISPDYFSSYSTVN